MRMPRVGLGFRVTRMENDNPIRVIPNAQAGARVIWHGDASPEAFATGVAARPRLMENWGFVDSLITALFGLLRRSFVPGWPWFVLLACGGYFLGARIGFALTFKPHPVSVLWPPNSILMAALLLTPRRAWWILLLAVLPAHWLVEVQSGVPSSMILCWYISNTCEALLGASAVRFFLSRPVRFDRLRKLGVFCFFGAFLAPFFSSFLDAGFVVLNHWGADSYWQLWRVRFTSNVLAALTITPFIVTWLADGIGWFKNISGQKYLEAIGLLLGVLLTSIIVFNKISDNHDPAFVYTPLPFLLWAAVRFGQRGATALVGALSFMAIWGAAHQHGPFARGSSEENALAVQLFLIFMSVPLLFLAALIEEREKAENTLSESEERFRTMADSAPVLIWMAGPDKLCTFLNKAWLGFTGRRLEQELGNGWAEGVHRDDFERCLATYHEAFDRRESFTMQYRLRRHDGVFRTITDEGVARYGPNGTFRGYIGACLDITESIEREKALREIKERVGLAAEAAQLGVWELDTNTGEVWISDKIRQLFQFGPDEKVTYTEFQQRVHPEDRARRNAAIERAIETRSEYEVEYRTLLPDGTIRWMTGRGRCITDDDGKSCRLIGVSMDVTNRKIAEEEARSRRQQLELLSRVSLLGEMTASIAHELNQPLAAIMSNASAGQRFIERGKVDPETLREILIDVAAEGRRAHDVVQNIRDTIKTGTFARYRVDMNQLVKNVTHLIEPNVTVSACEIETSLAPDLPEVEGNPVQLQQVLINLITNACEAMAEVPSAMRKVNIATERKNPDTIHVSVRDFGAGIPSEARSRLFEQFFTTKTEGLGMGLAIVRSIVEAHGGRIIAENVNNGGARFYFSLPIANDRTDNGDERNGFRD